LKIVSVLTSGSRGGAEYAAVALLDALAARGHEAVLLSNLEGIASGTSVRERPLALGPKLGARTVAALLARAPLLLARLRRALQREAPFDVLLLHFKKEQLLALSLPRRLRPVLAWAEWGPVPEPLRHGLPNRLYRLAGRRAQAVLAVSSGTAGSLVDAGLDPARVHVVPNAVVAARADFDAAGRDRLRTALAIPDDAFAVGCISRFNRKKRNDVAVDAAVLLAREPGARPVHLIMAGEGETEPELRARARPLGAAAHFLPTPGDRMTAVLSACDAVVFCPSPTEGAPLAVIMAMLARRPCVASGPEGVADLIAPGTGAIAEPEHDPRAVAALLRGYRDDRDRTLAEGAAARQRAAALHDAQAIGERVERLLA
jgi:glycosyltransferase involved in cell wall biosynthesis